MFLVVLVVLVFLVVLMIVVDLVLFNFLFFLDFGFSVTLPISFSKSIFILVISFFVGQFNKLMSFLWWRTALSYCNAASFAVS